MPDTDSNNQQPIVLIGAGGHAKVVADALLAQGATIAGYYDDAPDPAAAVVLPRATHLGPLSGAATEQRPMILALGALESRRKVIEACPGRSWTTAVHPSAIVSPSASVAPGTLIAPRAVINPSASIGSHAIINTGAIIEHDCSVGENTHIGPGAILSGGVKIGKDTLLGSGAIVLPGIRIGSRCVIGAGSVVTRDVPDNTRVIGSPARSY